MNTLKRGQEAHLEWELGEHIVASLFLKLMLSKSQFRPLSYHSPTSALTNLYLRIHEQSLVI